MIHITNRLTVDTYTALVQCILSFICLSSSFTALLLFPGIRHHRWRLLYLIKVLYITCSVSTILGSQWWFDWYCGKVSTTEHYSALVQELVPTTLILHIGLDGLRIDYTAKLPNKILTYQSFSRIAYDGLHFPMAIDEYDDKINKLQTNTPLPVRWVLDQFKQSIDGPQFGFTFYNKAFYTAQLLWCSLVCLSIGWCFVKFSDTMHGFALIILAGILQLLSALVFSCYHSAPAKVFVGDKILSMHLHDSYYYVFTSGCVQVVLGCSLVFTSQFLPCVNNNIFKPKEVEFIEPLSRLNSIKKRYTSYHVDSSKRRREGVTGGHPVIQRHASWHEKLFAENYFKSDSTSSKCSKKLKNSCRKLKNSIVRRDGMAVPIVIKTNEGQTQKQFSSFNTYGSNSFTFPRDNHRHISECSKTHSGPRVHWQANEGESSVKKYRNSAIKYVINVEEDVRDPETAIIMPETNI